MVPDEGFASLPSCSFFRLFLIRSQALKMPGSAEKLQPSSHIQRHVFFILF